MSGAWPSLAPPMLSHRPVVTGERGMVVAGHHDAAACGVAMLRAGGNAIDGAVATAAALAIAIPFMNGLGGDCMALYARGPSDIIAINGSGCVARAASPAELNRRGYTAMPARGPMTVSVPGFVATLGEALERFGTLPFAQVIEPAIALAEDGVALDASDLGFFNGPVYAGLARDYPALGAMFGAPGGWRLGQRRKQPAAARALRRLAKDGWRAFYEGPLAEEWLATAREAGVLLDRDDLAAHRTDFVKPLSIPWRGRRVHAAPPNAQGLALLAILGLTPAGTATAEARSGGGDTSTFVVIDKDGRAVSWVQSLFDEFGSGVVCPDHGIVLHNRAALERLDDDPVRGLKGGCRPLHTLCPALVCGPDGERTAIATPGDHGQPQTLAQVLRRHFEQGLDIQAAIEWPRLRHDSGPDVMLEDRCPQSWDAVLAEAGWAPGRVGPWSRLMGGVNAIVRRPDGLLMGGADPRRSCYALAA